MLFQNILCTFLGHKSDKTALAYEIKSHDTFYEVKIYEVSKCSRCNKIYEKLIEKQSIFFWLGVCAGVVGTAIYNVKKTRQFWHEATLGMTDFDIKCINEEYVKRKLKGNIMTNGEKYAGESHNHYVFERMCPKCKSTVCGREPSDFRECKIKDKHDYEQWLKEYNEDD